MSLRTASLAFVLCLYAANAYAADRERTQRVGGDALMNTGGWYLTSITAADGSARLDKDAPETDIRVTFYANAIRAMGGCNELQGTFKLSGKRMDIQMPPPDPTTCDARKAELNRRFGELLSRRFEAVLLEPQPYRMRLTAENGDVLIFQAMPLPL